MRTRSSLSFLDASYSLVFLAYKHSTHLLIIFYWCPPTIDLYDSTISLVPCCPPGDTGAIPRPPPLESLSGRPAPPLPLAPAAVAAPHYQRWWGVVSPVVWGRWRLAGAAGGLLPELAASVCRGGGPGAWSALISGGVLVLGGRGGCGLGRGGSRDPELRSFAGGGARAVARV
jgi:hypothetical protein